jgi:hypothetical protein
MVVDETSVLKLDIDCRVDDDWIRNKVRAIVAVCKSFQVTVNSIKMCRSKRKGIHFYISIQPPVESSFANQLQWLLGDDPARVDFNRARIESDLTEWNKLFEVAGRKLRAIYRRVRR